MFWKARLTWDCKMHRIIGLSQRCCGPKLDDGQLLIDRAQSWEAINLSLAMLRDLERFGNIVPHEVDAWMGGWHTLGQPFASCSLLPEVLESIDGGTTAGVTCHFDLQGERLFQNRAQVRWSLFGHNPCIPGALFEGECRVLLNDLRRLWPERAAAKQKLCGEVVNSPLREELLSEPWLLTFGEFDFRSRDIYPHHVSLAPGDEATITRLPCSRYREIRFMENGTLGEYSVPAITYWQLEQSGSSLVLRLFSEGETMFASLVFSAGTWIGRRADSANPADLEERSYVTLRRLDVIYAGSRPAKPDVSVSDIRRQINTRFGTSLKIVNSSSSLSDHIVSVYACAAAVKAGMPVTFHTPFAAWLGRVEQQGLEINLGVSVVRDEESPTIDLNDDPSACTKYGISKARWHASLIHAELAPQRPDAVRRDIEAERLGFRRYIVLAPCSRTAAQDWPEVHWTRLIYLLRESGFELLVTGAADQEERVAGICMGTNAFWVTNESPEWLSDVLLGAAALISHENDLAHFAGLLAVPTMVLHSHFQAQFLWECTAVTGITPKTKCASCRLQVARLYDPGCVRACSALHTIGPEFVIEQLQQSCLRSQINGLNGGYET